MANKNLSNVAKIAAVCAVAVAVLAGARSIWVRDGYQEATAVNSANVTANDVKDGFVEEFKYGQKLGEVKDAPVENANNPAPSATMKPFRIETADNVANATAGDVKDAPVENWRPPGKVKDYDDGQQLITDDNGVGKLSWGEVKDAPVENGSRDVTEKKNEDVKQLAAGENEEIAEGLKDDTITDMGAAGGDVGQDRVPRIPGTRSEITEIVYDTNELQGANELIAPEPAKVDNTPYLIGGGVLAAVLLGGGYAIYRFKRQTLEQKQ